MLLDVAETGIPLTTIANSIQMSGVMEGIHSIDSGILALPIIMEMMLLIVDAAGIEYNSGMDQEDNDKSIDTNLLLSKMDKIETEEQPEDIPIMGIEEDTDGGLMSRRQ